MAVTCCCALLNLALPSWRSCNEHYLDVVYNASNSDLSQDNNEL